MSDKEKKGKGTKESKILYCSFCGKGQNEVRKLIAGPSVYICDECVDLCNNIIEEELSDEEENQDLALYKPKEIKSMLDDYVIDQDIAKKASPYYNDAQTTDPDFEAPSSWRGNIALDITTENGYQLTVEYNKDSTNEGVFYRELGMELEGYCSH